MTEKNTSTSKFSDIDIRQSITAMSIFVVGLGIMSLILPRFSSPFGIVLIFTGFLNYYLYVAAVLLVGAILFFLGAAFNVLAGGVPAVSSSIYLFIIPGVITFRQYRSYRFIDIEEPSSNLTPIKRSEINEENEAQQFPKIAILLAGLSLIGFTVTLTSGEILSGASFEIELPQTLNFLFELFLELGVLGFAFGLALLLSGYRHKALSVLASLVGVGSMAMMVIALLMV